MSRDNILSMGWAGSEFHVVFDARDGERTYAFDAISGAQIEMGVDPNRFSGVQIAGERGIGRLGEAGELEEGAELGEAAELLELLAL
jgi:hypothetical protein